MTSAHGNRKLVEQLRLGLDLEATRAALDRGEITRRQAANIVKWITGVVEIRENPRYVVTADDGQHIGEVITENRGASWIGRRYGKNYRNDAREFSDRDEAFGFVVGQSRGAPRPQ